MSRHIRLAALSFATILAVACTGSPTGCESQTAYAGSRAEADALVALGWSCEEGPKPGFDGPFWTCTRC